jgi:non-canonical (house-cleaning) NTP pyrophosphatase
MIGVIGSANRLEYAAAIRALDAIAKGARLDVLFVRSVVNMQPIGPEETYIGARYRADMTRAQLPGSDFV